MNTSFFNGISGIKSHQFGLDVWADNISNISTIGFRSSNPEFANQFSTALTDAYFDATTNNMGLGSKAQTTSLSMTQGILEPTDSVFDLALGGEGWFGVQAMDSQTYYTRSGAFSIDANGDLVDAEGNYLMGTAGGNITATSLSQNILDQFGRYYGVDSTALGEPYSISRIDDVSLDAVSAQGRINLPDLLYFPPEATTSVTYSANLDPKIITGPTQIDLDTADIGTSTVDTTNKTISVAGTITNTTALLNPQSGDVVILTITDASGATVDINTALTNSFTWTLSNGDISALDTTNPLTVTAKLQTVQEIPNVEHFSSQIISPSGEKNILDMTYTKRVPQPSTGSVWDGTIEIHSFYENYALENYDSTVTYDPTQYNVYPNLGYVEKIYDPSLYKVDKTAGKVYEIIDSQSAVVEFGSDGSLLSSTMPTLSNEGTSLTIDVGSPNSFTGFVSNVDLDKARTETHDGYIAGLLKDYGMDGRGNIVAEFDNGRSTPVAKVAVYHFVNDQGLNKITSTMFSASSNSGEALFYTDDNGNFVLGTPVYSNRLEGSNVSFATALTELIVMQKAFDASSKSITTSDEMIQRAINMKM